VLTVASVVEDKDGGIEVPTGALRGIAGATLIFGGAPGVVGGAGALLTNDIYGTINLTDLAITRESPSIVRVAWIGWGHPNPLVEPAMQWVATRTSVNIWHQPYVQLECRGQQGFHTLLSYAGSKFPSRRLWINGALLENVRQGAFADLWKPAAWDETFVA
jgi:hypothetical protein